MNNIQLKPFFACLFVSVGTGVLATLFTKSTLDLYLGAARPALFPPAFLFPLIWGVLFMLAGFGLYLIFISGAETRLRSAAIDSYMLQLAAGFMWSIIFFNLRSFGFASIWLVLMLGLLLYTMHTFRRISCTAALLLIPYLLWILFTGYLSFAVWLRSA